MNTRIVLLPLLIAFASLAFAEQLLAQATAFAYQGRLADGGTPATGSYDLTFTLFSVSSGGITIATPQTNSAVAVSNGLFMVTLDFGASFPGADRFLEIAARTNGGGAFTTLIPRQKLTATPYALTARNITGVVPGTSLSGTYSSAVTLNNAGNSFSGNGAALTGVNAATLGGVSASGLWRTTGNSGTTAANFLGTTDNQPLELRANGQRGLQLQPGITGFGVSVVAGSNSIEFVSPAATISGGHGNLIRSGGFYSTIGGGYSNLLEFSVQQSVIAGGMENRMAISANSSAIGGGWQNLILSNTVMSVIAGGWANTVGPFATASTVGGGYQNSIQMRTDQATISGGRFNRIQQSNEYATISGGAFNEIQTRASDSAIGGGFGNTIGTNAQSSVIGGGGGNRIDAVGSVIGGGGSHRIEATARNSSIGGGDGNHILFGSSQATISGGLLNRIDTNAAAAFIGGGSNNEIGSNAMRATITGGSVNEIQADAEYSTISGGQLNAVAPGCTFSTIGGGKDNHIANLADFATVPGGGGNTAGGHFSFAAGRQAQALHDGAFVWADFSSQSAFASTRANQFLIRAAGGVGVGRATTANALEVEGNASKTAAGSWLANSDARIKTGIRTVTGALDKLSQVRLVEFHYTDEYRAQHPGLKDRSYLNVVAQEFQKVFPEHVQSSGEKLPDGDAILQVDTYPLTIYSTAAIQELNRKLTEELKRRDTENAELKRSVEELKTLVNALVRKSEGGAR